MLLWKLQDTVVSYFICCCITSVFLSAVSIFYNFLEHSTLSKKDLCHKFSFFNRFTQAPHSLNNQNLLSMTSFCSCSFTCRYMFNKNITKAHATIPNMYLFLTVSNCFQYIIKNVMSSTKISAQNANKFFCHIQAIKI